MGLLLIGFIMLLWSIRMFSQWFKYNPKTTQVEMDKTIEEIGDNGFNPKTFVAASFGIIATLALIEMIYIFYVGSYVGQVWFQLIAAVIITWKLYGLLFNSKSIMTLKWKNQSKMTRAMSFISRLLFVLYNLFFIGFLFF